MRGPARFAVVLFCFFSFAFRLSAAPTSISEAEKLSAPSPERINAIYNAALGEGWAAQSTSLHSAARSAFAKEKLAAAAAWLRLYRWSVVLGQTEGAFTSAWIKAVESARVAHDGMPKKYELRPQPLGTLASPELQSWFLHHAAFSDEFFSLAQPVDYLPNVFRILSDLYRHDPVRFEHYASLALAIAAVYDVPPPSDWPHAQVSATILPRRWHDPVATFDWFVQQDQSGRTYQSLARLHADELKFVVDVTAPFTELEWAQKSVAVSLNQLEQAYRLVSYRNERISKNTYLWSEKDYQLQTILATGGICVDQAYFANQVGKARGVPTLLFSGTGNDGRHAWFGFLDGNQQWRLDAGRYAEQRFATGLARDPQTWAAISDHELIFLSERFRSSAAFQDSLVLAEFATDLLADGDAASAVKAARKAVLYERRNAPAWEILIAAELAAGIGVREREATMREAMIALSRYPDLELTFSRRLSESLRARGETSAADFEQRRVVKKYELGRTDLALRQAREALWRTRGDQNSEAFIRSYNATVDRLGPGEGIAFFDEIVAPVVEFLMQRNEPDAARNAIERARRTLRVVPGSQLEREFSAISDKLGAKR